MKRPRSAMYSPTSRSVTSLRPSAFRIFERPPPAIAHSLRVILKVFLLSSVNCDTASAGIAVGFSCRLYGVFSLALSPPLMAGFLRCDVQGRSAPRRSSGVAHRSPTQWLIISREVMNQEQFQNLPIELWDLHTLVDAVLAARIAAKKDELETRLEQLRHKDVSDHSRG